MQISDPEELNTLLQGMGVTACEEGALLIKRTIKESGAGQNFMNNTAVTLQVMRKVSRLLADMHGPHDHQSLFDTDFQRELLDEFGSLTEKRIAYEKLYEELHNLESRQTELAGTDENVSAEIELLTFRVQEIRDAQLDPDEEVSLVEEHRTLANVQYIQQHGWNAVNRLIDDEASAFDSLVDVQRALTEFSDDWDEAKIWLEEARQTAIQVQELGTTIRRTLDGLEANPERLAWLDERLATYDKMKRKYGPSLSDVLRHLQESTVRLEDLQMRGERLAKLEKEIDAQHERTVAAGTALHQCRIESGERLASCIMEHLEELGLKHAKFESCVTKGKLGPQGLDHVEFGFAPNPGEAMRPLRAIASSGEISRVMLACKVVLAELDRIPVLVFDEVDANVGGEMGHIIGTKLAALSLHRQVLCITHLPQAAVHGSLHLAVSKKIQDGRTCTKVTPLDPKARVQEITRMLGGTPKTKATMQHAEEMLAQAKVR